MNDLFQLAKEKTRNNAVRKEGVEIDLNLKPKIKINLKECVIIPFSSNTEISEDKSTLDLSNNKHCLMDNTIDKLVSGYEITKKTRSGLHNKESGRNKAKKKYGDGNTPEAIAKKRRTNVINMNNGTDTNPQTLRKYNITKADIIDITLININVINYFNLNKGSA